MTTSQVKKKITKCSEPNCSKKRGGNHKLCFMHRNRKHREKHPIRAAYQILKDNAKRRGKPFEIRLIWFTEFIKDSGYIEGKGRLADSMTIDRIKNHLGYIEGNIQVIQKSQNVVKFWHVDLKDCGIVVADGSDLPF
jgi:hypothetical protein